MFEIVSPSHSACCTPTSTVHVASREDNVFSQRNSQTRNQRGWASPASLPKSRIGAPLQCLGAGLRQGSCRAHCRRAPVRLGWSVRPTQVSAMLKNSSDCGAGVAAYWGKLPPAMPASHRRVGSSPGCCTAKAAPC